MQVSCCLDAAGILAFKCTKRLQRNTFLISHVLSWDGFVLYRNIFRVVDQKEDKGRVKKKVVGWRRVDKMRVKIRDRRFWPDSDVGTLSQSASRTLQSSVDLSHLYCPFQANHLQELVTEVWKNRITERVRDKDRDMLPTHTERWLQWKALCLTNVRKRGTREGKKKKKK